VLSSRRNSRRSGQKAAVMVEYVLLLAFVVLVGLIGIKTLGGTATNKFGANNNSVTNAFNN
jgi:Flp pilus assembly pilin Flp